MKQTILFGNGINRVCNDNLEWGNVLERINKGTIPRDEDGQCSIPYTFLYEDIIINRVDTHLSSNGFSFIEQDIKQVVIDYLCEVQTHSNNSLYDQLFDIPANYYLTTNYDTVYSNALNNKGFTRIAQNNNELAYNMRRWRQWKNARRKIQIWPIHGTIDARNSIMLGFDHYSGSISRLYDYLNTGKYTRAEVSKVNNDLSDYRKTSSRLPYIIYRISHSLETQLLYWVDTFFMSDVHIIGNAFKFDEIDLWWILNKRMRLMKSYFGIIKNTVYYYGYVEKDICYMLKSYGVNVSSCTTIVPPDNEGWKSMYIENIKKINYRVKNSGNNN